MEGSKKATYQYHSISIQNWCSMMIPTKSWWVLLCVHAAVLRRVLWDCPRPSLLLDLWQLCIEAEVLHMWWTPAEYDCWKLKTDIFKIIYYIYNYICLAAGLCLFCRPRYRAFPIHQVTWAPFNGCFLVAYGCNLEGITVDSFARSDEIHRQQCFWRWEHQSLAIGACW